MKLIPLVTMVLTLTSLAFAQNKRGTFAGEIMDKQCAQMQSHENMMKAQGAKDAKDCTLKCVKNGDMFALFDPESKKVYPIDDEKKVREFAGRRVRITGSYDRDAEILHVKSISPVR